MVNFPARKTFHRILPVARSSIESIGSVISRELIQLSNPVATSSSYAITPAVFHVEFEAKNLLIGESLRHDLDHRIVYQRSVL